jgi:hypothetical protein
MLDEVQQSNSMDSLNICLVLCFCFGLIQHSTSSFLTCECGHGLDAFGMHLVRCPFRGQQIATHDAIQNVMYALT